MWDASPAADWWQIKIRQGTVCHGQTSILGGSHCQDYCPAYSYLNLHPLRSENILSEAAEKPLPQVEMEKQLTSQTLHKHLNWYSANWRENSLITNICNFVNDLSGGWIWQIVKQKWEEFLRFEVPYYAQYLLHLTDILIRQEHLIIILDYRDSLKELYSPFVQWMRVIWFKFAGLNARSQA